MSGARFARSGRTRFFICFLALVLMLGMVAIFHNTTRQLDEARGQRLRCEQQQESLNEQLQTIIDQKFSLQKTYDVERKAQLQSSHNMEQKIEQSEQLSLEARVRYDNLQQAHKKLQNEHNVIIKREQQQLEEAKVLKRNLENLRAEKDKELDALNHKVAMWQEKYNTLEHEKVRLGQLVTEYEAVCKQQPHVATKFVAKASAMPEKEHLEAKKSFSQQLRVSDGRYLIDIKPSETNRTNTTSAGVAVALPFALRPNNSLILNSVENFQMLPNTLRKISAEQQSASPLSAPQKQTSTEANQREKPQLQPAQDQLGKAGNASRTLLLATPSSSAMAPMPVPAHLRQVPANVAPIPNSFDYLLKQETQQGSELQKNMKIAGDVVEQPPNKAQVLDNHDKQIVSDLDLNKSKNPAALSNEHKLKENDEFMNDAKENLFDAAQNVDNAGIAAVAVSNNEDEDLLGKNLAADDVENMELKQHNPQRLLNADNVNNEVAGDHGKEFDDGLHLDEGVEEDVEEDDDYLNSPVRKHGEEAIRN